MSDAEAPSTLRPLAWALRRFGYEPNQRTALMTFAKKHGVPFVRRDRDVFFDEAEVREWFAIRYPVTRRSGPYRLRRKEGQS